MVLDTYGKSTGFCIDPIEKKPLNHFLPGTPVLSFGTAGCNLGCKFCQNWDISKSREIARLSDEATPEAIAAAALHTGCRSVAFTYNDPVIWAEYAIDTAKACHSVGVKTVAVTAGYISPAARGEFFESMDASNIDLKAFTESFYHNVTASHLQPVLDTIQYVCNETDCWVELTNLVIPNANDGADEFQHMCDWILATVGPNVPIHFTAFHPDFRLMDRANTPHETLIAAYEIARRAGLNYVYIGNVHDVARQSTSCHACGQLLIERDWHQLGQYNLDGNRCANCQAEIPGRFESVPGNWGRKRQPIRIASDSLVTLSAAPQVKPMITTQDSDVATLSQDELSIIHCAACEAVQAAVTGGSADVVRSTLGELASRPVHGVYVTLKRAHALRGCCGSQGSTRPLVDVLIDSAYRTAREDPRMPSIVATELPYLDVTVSVLGSPRPIGAVGADREKVVKIGQHGLRILLGQSVGLLLPSVAVENNWNARQFLDAVCKKAGLPAGAWRSEEADVRIFDGVSLSRPMKVEPAAQTPAEPRVLSVADLESLAEWVKQNLVAMQMGATPFYYAMNVSDANVPGIALQIQVPGVGAPAQWMQLSLRESVALQSTLFQFTQTAASSMRGMGDAIHWNVTLAVLSQTTHHSAVNEVDLRGVTSNQRALVITDTKRWSVCYDETEQIDAVLRSALNLQPFRDRVTQVYSMRCECNSPKLSISISPQGQPKVVARAPAVAGSFYPGDDAEREALLDSFLADLPPAKKTSVAAVMVPHAGLRFSGPVAADVWRRLEIPETVLIIGPKHTADGVDWAVAPHDRWHMSATASVAGSSELAASLAESVPGMQLDSGAHRREHGIEVQLPFLHRFAPESRLVAIAMHGGTLDELQSASESLAKWIRTLEKPTLLVISSDMNHFADDEENRRRDRLALNAMKSFDPAALLAVCEAESISMCGQIPAALVMLTLKAMGMSMNYREVAYATSADVTGDTSRVVGYAGVLL